MPRGKFIIQLTDVKSRLVSQLGHEDIEFLVTTNPGQPARPLAKVASGGELSRISLAIQVIIARKALTPTMVFDEVDVGIGGGTAEIVGGMLRELGDNGQILLCYPPASGGISGTPSFACAQEVWQSISMHPD